MLLNFRTANDPGDLDADESAIAQDDYLTDSSAPDGFPYFGVALGGTDWQSLTIPAAFVQLSSVSSVDCNGPPQLPSQRDAGAAFGVVDAGPQLTGGGPGRGTGSTNSVSLGGATAAQVQEALDESGLNVNGAGIMVGVLSDSFNDLGGAAADEADGALPPAASIEVLKDLGSGGTDEGRAMMQIVHDIAPGASLAFYTAFDGEQDFADGILALAAAGCKVICDDVTYFDEPFFQSGIVAQAIETVEAEGVTYVTAAGNNGGNAYQAAWTPISGLFDGVALTNAESFAGKLVQTVTVGLNFNYEVPFLLEWNEPYGGANSNLELLVFEGGELVGKVTNSDVGEPSNPWTGVLLPGGATYQIAIEDLSAPNSSPGLIKEIAAGDGIPVTISGANVGTVYGHAMTPGVITAGAVSAADTPAFGVTPPQSESFSSTGAGTELLFNDNGAAISPPELLSPVVVSGLDDIETTLAGGLGDFYGTSAASASLAGVAALILAANPDLAPAQVEQIVEQSAIPMANPAVSGAGLVQIDPAVGEALDRRAPDDFTGSDISDILFRNDSSGDVWFEAMSNGAFTGWRHIGPTLSTYDVVGVGDFSADGTDDILLRNGTTGDVGFYQMSNGINTGWHDIGGSSTAYSVVGLGDFYGNGNADILYRNNSTGDTWFEALSNGAFAGWQQITGSDTNYAVVGVGDFGNGTDDILFRNNSTGDTWYAAISNGSFVGWFQVGGSNTSYSVVGIGDFYGNGNDDILYRNNSSGDTWFEAMSNGNFAGWFQIAGSNTNYAVAAIGDYFGTGTDDILFRSNATGDTWFVAMSNGAFAGWYQVSGSNTSYTVKT
jgi:Subtilase family